MAADAGQKGITFLDCPVSGGSARAERGALALICGGDVAVLERCRPLLEVMGRVHRCGVVGMGQVAKLANHGMHTHRILTDSSHRQDGTGLM